MFGKTDPIYVQVKNIGKDPDIAEYFYAAVPVKTQYSPYIYLSLQETGVDTQIFRNSVADELLYLSDTTDIGNRKIKIINEEVLYFWLAIPPNSFNYKWSEHVMVDRAEIGTEYQRKYLIYCKHGASEIPTDRFGRQLFDNIGGEPNLVWFKNFCEPDINSLLSHWHKDTDSPHADSVDMTSWGGHCGSSLRSMHIFKEDKTCNNFLLRNTELGNTDADWIIFDMCFSLNGSINDLKYDLVSSVSGQRCAHLFCGFIELCYHSDPNCGKFFADRLNEVGIKEAWFDYCENKQPSGTVVRIFGAEDCMNDSVAGPGPTKVSRDPTKDSDWTYEDYPPPP